MHKVVNDCTSFTENRIDLLKFLNTIVCRFLVNIDRICKGRHPKMKKKYNLLEGEGGVELIAHGPYRTNHERDNAAKQILQRQQEDNRIFWVDTDETGTLAVGPYTAGFFCQEP
jgi:hypothetical protein